MQTYPTTLPMPQTDNYTGTIDFGIVRTNIPTGNASQRINNNSPTTEISMTFKMKNDDSFLWLTWVFANAYQYFNMPVVSGATPTNITSVQRVRFISTIQLDKLGDDWSSYTVAAEIVPGDFLL
jgi:hypothetical protein